MVISPGSIDLPTSASIELPAWMPDWWDSHVGALGCSDQAGRMGLVGELALENVRRGGGPFSAGIWDEENRSWVSLGVNLVLSSGLSCAHAEVVAISLAQTALGTWNLGEGGRRLELVSSAEPCAMCTGAVPWSGVGSLVFGAGKEEAEAAGFDEGAKPRGWVEELEKRGIRVSGPVEGEATREALRKFAAEKVPYNGRPRRAD